MKKLTKTQSAVLAQLAGKIQNAPYSSNHVYTARNFLLWNGFAEYNRIEQDGKSHTTVRLTEAGKKLAESL